jgi:nucleotide-binding universal stress UspA family protein
MYDDVCLPTDGSAGMDRVIEHAVELARTHDATIHAIYVVNTASLSNLPLEASMDAVSQSLHDEGRAAMNEVERLVPDDVDLETTTVEGSPAREIVDYVTRSSCDIVVMGTHGRSGVDRLLLGSVAERVVRSSPVPVLSVRVGGPDDNEETE